MKRLLIFSLLTSFLFMGIAGALNAAAYVNSGENASKDVLNKASSKDLQEKNITFNFPHADIREFARFVARLCGKSLVGERLIKGHINIRSHKKMSLSQVKDVFRTLLNSKALDYTESDVYLEIVPMTGSIVKVYPLQYLKASEVAKSLSEIYRENYRAGSQPQNIQITAVDDANSLMVLAPKSTQQEIENSIKRIDVRSRQVIMDIMVVELTKNEGFGYGINFNWSDGNHNVSLVPGSTNKFTSSGIPSASQYSFKKGQWSLDLQAVDKNTRIKILSQPRVIALENQKSDIKIGEKQKYINGSSSLSGNYGNTQTTATNDIGLDIQLTPRINKLRNVVLDLKFKITNVVDSYQYTSGTIDTSDNADSPVAAEIQIPVVGHRIINNTSTVGDGDTLVIGGLLKNQKVTVRTAPPLLGELPLIGWAFTKEEELTEQNQLMVFITPTVIENTKDARRATQAQKNKLREFDEEHTEDVDQMLTGKKTPTDNVFNVFDYFLDKKYRKDQDFVPHGY